MDDVTLSGEMSTVEEDVCTILQASAETGLHLNTAKCKIIMEDFTAIASSSPLADFVRVEKSEMMLLGAPVTKGKTQDKAISNKIEQGRRSAVIIPCSRCSSDPEE